MSTSVKTQTTPEPVSVRVDDVHLIVDLADGRTISAPTQWFPRLFHGTQDERGNVELSHSGIHWPDLNEDISVRGLLDGRRSGESRKSIQRWLDLRAQGKKEEAPVLPLPDWFGEVQP